MKKESEWELTFSTRRWAKDRTVISTARADYRSDLASSLVVNFHDILNNVRINKEAVEKTKFFLSLSLYQQPIFYTDNAPLRGLHSMERGNQHHEHRRRNQECFLGQQPDHN